MRSSCTHKYAFLGVRGYPTKMLFAPAIGSQTTEPNAYSTPVFVDEFHARRFKGMSHDLRGGAAGLDPPRLQLADGHDADLRCVGKLLLIPVQQSSGSPALFGGDHRLPILPPN